MFSKLFFCAVTPSHHDVAQVMGGCGNARGNHGRVGCPRGSMGVSIVMGVPKIDGWFKYGTSENG